MVSVEAITKIERPINVEVFLNALLGHAKEIAGGRRRPTALFRGHSNCNWTLSPSALRPGAFKGLFWPSSSLKTPMFQRDQLDAELKVMSEFIEELDSIGLPIPDDSMQFRESLEIYDKRLFNAVDYSDEVIWPPRRFLAVLALARHSGLPTRLLDWTTDPFRAAYFAAKGAAVHMDVNNYLCVWSVDRRRFKRMAYPGVRNVGSNFDRHIDMPVEFFNVPSASNPNAHAQRGWFTVVRTDHKLEQSVDRTPLDGVVANAMQEASERAPVFYKFELPQLEAPRLLEALADRGIKASTVFPNYAGAADALYDWALYQL